MGQDAYKGWGPLVSEYLKGDDIYRNSPMFFGGQNLLAIHGELPLWRITRWLNFNFIQTLNYSLFFFIVFFQFYLYQFFLHFNKHVKLYEIYLVLIISIFHPVIFNRIFSGHINLLYTLLPSFSFLVIILNPKKAPYLLNIVVMWFAFSIQGYL